MKYTPVSVFIERNMLVVVVLALLLSLSPLFLVVVVVVLVVVVVVVVVVIVVVVVADMTFYLIHLLNTVTYPPTRTKLIRYK